MTAQDWQQIVAGQMREIEESFQTAHNQLINWSRWGMGRNFESPFLVKPAIWSMPGETDPDRDPEAAPHVPQVPVNEKTAREMDEVINDPEFPAVWRKVICVHYLHPKYKWGGYFPNPTPAWQRPGCAGMTAEGYISQLRTALDHLSVGQA